MVKKKISHLLDYTHTPTHTHTIQFTPTSQKKMTQDKEIVAEKKEVNTKGVDVTRDNGPDLCEKERERVKDEKKEESVKNSMEKENKGEENGKKGNPSAIVEDDEHGEEAGEDGSDDEDDPHFVEKMEKAKEIIKKLSANEVYEKTLRRGYVLLWHLTAETCRILSVFTGDRKLNQGGVYEIYYDSVKIHPAVSSTFEKIALFNNTLTRSVRQLFFYFCTFSMCDLKQGDIFEKADLSEKELQFIRGDTMGPYYACLSAQVGSVPPPSEGGAPNPPAAENPNSEALPKQDAPDSGQEAMVEAAAGGNENAGAAQAGPGRRGDHVEKTGEAVEETPREGQQGGGSEKNQAKTGSEKGDDEIIEICQNTLTGLIEMYLHFCDILAELNEIYKASDGLEFYQSFIVDIAKIKNYIYELPPLLRKGLETKKRNSADPIANEVNSCS